MCRLYIAGRRLYPFLSVYSLGSQVAAVSTNSQFYEVTGIVSSMEAYIAYA